MKLHVAVRLLVALENLVCLNLNTSSGAGFD